MRGKHKFICNCQESRPCSHEIEFIEKSKYCLYCHELRNNSHHCSGKKAYQYGYQNGLKTKGVQDESNNKNSN